MKVKTKALVSFLDSVTIGGMIEDALLRFTDKGLCITVRDISSTGAISGVFFKSNFEDYKEGMEVAIEDTSRLMNLLKMIEGSAELVVESNSFRIIGENFEGVVTMKENQSLHCDVPQEKWDSLPISSYDEGFVIDAGIFDVARKAIGELTKKNSDINSKHIIASVKDGLFTLQTGEDTGDKAFFKAQVDYDQEAVADYGSTLLEFTEVMKGNIRVSFDDDRPILITSKNENSVVQWFVSPILH
jgi:hypothetical protein